MAKRYVTDRTADGSEVRRARPKMKSTNEVIRELVADNAARTKALRTKYADLDTALVDGWISDLESVYEEVVEFDWGDNSFIKSLVDAIAGLKQNKYILTQPM